MLRGPTSAAAMAALVRTAGGDQVTEAQVDAGVGRLADRLLLFVDAERTIWLNPGLVEAVPRPCGLGPPVAELLSNLSVSALRAIAAALGIGDATGSKAGLAAAIAARMADGQAVRDLLAARSRRGRRARAAGTRQLRRPAVRGLELHRSVRIVDILWRGCSPAACSSSGCRATGTGGRRCHARSASPSAAAFAVTAGDSRAAAGGLRHGG